ENPFQFVGQLGILSDGIGHESMRARSYEEALGRFISVDPIEILSGSINWIAYCNNDPISHVDPSGELTASQAIVGAALFCAAIYLAPAAFIFAAVVDAGLTVGEALGVTALAYPGTASFFISDAVNGYPATSAGIEFIYDRFNPEPDQPFDNKE